VVNYLDAMGEYFSYVDNASNLKDKDNYKMLLAQTSQQILKVVDRSFRSFFHVIKEKRKGNYNRSVSRPRFLPKEGEFILIFTKQNSKLVEGRFSFNLSKEFRNRHSPSFKTFSIRCPPFVTSTNLHEVRILPRYNRFEIEYVYEPSNVKVDVDESKVLGIDIGLDNLATCANMQTGRSFIVDGRGLKSYNHRYNKRVVEYQSKVNKEGIVKRTRWLKTLDKKRYWFVNDYMNQSVNKIVKHCIENRIGTIVVGENKEWKQEIHLGKRNNQNFVQIPHGIFRYKLRSKCERIGIAYISQEESHTSKCSFLDNESIEHHDKYLGKRPKRGYFVTSRGIVLNADTNAAANIARKSKEWLVNNERLCKGLTLNPRRVRIDHAPSRTSNDKVLASSS
jgi:IS605 OrfB family transposase